MTTNHIVKQLALAPGPVRTADYQAFIGSQIGVSVPRPTEPHSFVPSCDRLRLSHKRTLPHGPGRFGKYPLWTLEAVADRGYFNGEEIKACDDAGITVTLPKPMTSDTGISNESKVTTLGGSHRTSVTSMQTSA